MMSVLNVPLPSHQSLQLQHPLNIAQNSQSQNLTAHRTANPSQPLSQPLPPYQPHTQSLAQLQPHPMLYSLLDSQSSTALSAIDGSPYRQHNTNAITANSAEFTDYGGVTEFLGCSGSYARHTPPLTAEKLTTDIVAYNPDCQFSGC